MEDGTIGLRPIVSAGGIPTGWQIDYNNNTGSSDTFRGYAICVPAP